MEESAVFGIGIVGLLGWLIAAIGSIVALICAILVIVKVFEREGGGMGALAIALLIVCGGIPLFVWGWIKAGDWGVKRAMVWWTIAWVVSIIGVGMLAATGALLIPTQTYSTPMVEPTVEFGN